MRHVHALSSGERSWRIPLMRPDAARRYVPERVKHSPTRSYGTSL